MLPGGGGTGTQSRGVILWKSFSFTKGGAASLPQKGQTLKNDQSQLETGKNYRGRRITEKGKRKKSEERGGENGSRNVRKVTYQRVFSVNRG